jgi:hypothetical protein
MRELRYNNRRAEILRRFALGLFLAAMTILFFGLLVSMFYGSGAGVLVTLALASIFTGVAFVAGGIGWAQFEEPMTTVSPPPPEEAANLAHEWGEPYEPPRPADENRPPP